MSFTISGFWLAIIGLAAQKLHIEQTALVTTITTLVQIVGLIVVWYGRYRQGDITWYGKKLN